MSPERKRFLKNIEARVLPFTVFFLLVVAGLSAMFFVLPPENITVKAASTTDFDHYKQVWVQSSQVDNSLINFPVWFYQSSADYNGLDSDSFSFFDGTDGGATELPWEFEVYDDATDTIGAWVNISSISSSSNTSFYIFYDDSASNDGGENNPTGVWDSGFEAVWHMNGVVSGSGGTVDDSTSNGNDGTTAGGVTDEQTGVAGDCFDFNRADSEYFSYSAISPLSDFTLEAWGNNDDWSVPTADGNDKAICSWKTGTNEDWYQLTVYDDNSADSSIIQVSADTGNDDGGKKDAESGDIDTHVGWYYMVGVRDTSNTNLYLYLNESLVDTTSISGDTSNIVTSQQCVGGRGDGGAEYWDGLLDEIRISSVARNASWLKATFYSISSPSTFLEFGSEQDVSGSGSEEQCYYNTSGLDGSDRITFGSGQANAVLWSNATGNWDAGAMLEIEVSTNASVNIDDIIIDLKDTDLHTSVHWENISIDVAYSSTSFADANSSFPNDDYAVVDIDDGSGNVSLNASWDLDWANPNPFPLSNDTTGADHFFCVRFKLEVPSDATVGGPYTTDAWEVVWKTTGE